ncbi:MAG TPA: cytochrome c [Planctomycetes bacterium]|nr:cytochrome c [Planctomycetota bacterium]
MSRNRYLALLGAWVCGLSSACHFERATPELHYSLNEKALADGSLLEDDPAGQVHLLGALELLFGTPSQPSYMVLPEWLDDDFDPTYLGQDSFSDEAWAELVERNREVFADQIAAIQAGDLEGVTKPRYCEDLWELWLGLLDDMPEEGPDGTYYEDDDGNPVTWKEEAVATFEGYYPTLAASAELYRQQCYHCHGASGGGDGSTSQYLNPRPRDYRYGTFKFTALNNKARPRHQDLMRVLEEGIYTTAMPSFRRFSDAQLSGLADYVRLLSIRGETEILMEADYDPDEGIHFDNLRENYELVVDRWRQAPEELIVYEGEVPHATPERIARGRDLYMRDNAANCVKCHGMTGRGDGESVKNDPESSTDDWGNKIVPRDLTTGVFRFGRRPIDLYRRIYAGINGTPMPAHYGMQIVDGEGVTRSLNEDDVWDLVFYARSLSVKEREVSLAQAPHGESHGEHEE